MPRPSSHLGTAAAALAAAVAALIVGSAAIVSAGPPAAAAYPSTWVTGTPISPGSPRPAPWVPAPCATGEFTDVHTDADRNTVVSAAVSICGRYVDTFAFTLAGFRPGHNFSAVPVNALRKYNPVGPTPVQGAQLATPSSGEMAVCAMLSSTVRIACVRLTFQLTGPTTMEPISVDDPLVANAVVAIEPQLGEPVLGFCATCVVLP
jgi:hypothetical protein